MKLFQIALACASAIALGVIAFGVISSNDTEIGAAAGERTLQHCPLTGGRLIQTENPDADSELVPDGARSVLVCRYTSSGLTVDGRVAPQRLREGWVSEPHAVRRLERAFAALLPAYAGLTSCPSRSGRLHYLVDFRYWDDPDVYVRAFFETCGYAVNGVDEQVFDTTEFFRATLDEALRPPDRGMRH